MRSVRATKFAWGLASLLLMLSGLEIGCQTPHIVPPPDSSRVGKVLVLPGVSNLRSELSGLGELLNAVRPGLSVDVRTWGTVLRPVGNLRDHENQLAVARDLAADLAAYARGHPDHTLDLVGYSGGGAMALFVVAALPEDVSIDRLVLIAPAVSRAFPIESTVMPKVKDFAVLYSSVLDCPVSLGTLIFGTMDRRRQFSAGWSGFRRGVRRLLHVPWTPEQARVRHFGGHASYLSSSWQRKNLIPVFEPEMTIERLEELLN